MLKTAFVTFNLIFLVIFSVLLEDVKVTQEAPDRVKREGEFTVTVEIEKGAITGFAKYQVNLPVGVEAIEVESQGATFTYAQHKAKFIWMTLPEGDKFQIKYKVKVTDPYLAIIPLTGSFSYLDENKRMTVDVNEKQVYVGEQDIATEEIPDPEASVTRTITDLGNQKYLVTVVIDKENITGFAKIQDMVPSGAQVEVEKDMGAVFSKVDRKVKFIWMDLPSANPLEISYTVDLSSASNKSPTDIDGEFAFLHKGESQKVIIGSEALAAVVEETQEKGEVIDSTPVYEEIAETDEVVVEETPPVIEEDPIIPEPSQGIDYRVQILAAHRSVQSPYFQKNHSFTGAFNVENHEGWVKYTVGDFSVYKDARNHRNSLTAHKFPGPFVVAYNDGTRITVQEALMITNQQWVK